jgi:predicted permease
MLYNYFKIAFRNLWRNKSFSAINVIGLALGMAVCILIGLYVTNECSYDRFHTRFDRIYRVVETQKQADGMHPVAVTPGPLAAALQSDFAEVEKTARIGSWHGLLQHEATAVDENILIVDGSLFEVFDFPMVSGNPRKLLANPDEVILTEKMAAVLFGSDWKRKGIIGQTIVLTDTQTRPVKVVGVARNLPANSHIQTDVFLSFKTLEKYDEWSMKWNSNSYHTYLLLHSQADNSGFGKKLSGYLKKYDVDAETLLQLQPLADIYLRSVFDFQTDWGNRNDITYIYLFTSIGLLVLIIAVFNFVNLATARATQRGKEVGVRKISGASQHHLIFQFLIETLLVVSLASGLALIMAHSLLPLVNDLSGKNLSLPVASVTFGAIVLVFGCVTALLAGLYPAFVLSSFQPTRVLKGVFTVRSGKLFRKALVVGQFALSITLIISTWVIYRQLQFVQNKKLGFDKEQLVYVRLKGDLRGKSHLLTNDYKKLAGVASAAATTSTLVDVTNSSGMEWEGQQPKDEFLITQVNVDPDFISTVKATLVAGRNFSYAIASDTSDVKGAYLINETAAKRMGWTAEEAIGKTVKFWGFPGSIVGVVKDFHFRSLRVKIEPLILRFRPKEFYFQALVKVKPSLLKQTLAQLSGIYAKYEPTQPFSYGFVDQDMERLYGNEQRTRSILMVFSVLTIFISCLGLFGLASFTAEQRTKEIGIRKVLGASVTSIMQLLSRDFLKLVLIAFGVAIPLAWYISTRWLQDFAYKTAVSWWIFAATGVLALLIALLTISFQAVKAAIANPVKSLRSE